MLLWDPPEFALGSEFYLVWMQTRHNEYMSHVGAVGGRREEEMKRRRNYAET